MRSDEIATEVGTILRNEVPGLMAYTNDLDYGATAIVIKYECPCGELSGMARVMLDGPIAAPRYHANVIKEELRRHVISEGTVPNF